MFFLSACQSTFQLVPKTDDTLTLNEKQLNHLITNKKLVINPSYNVALSCSGLFRCNLTALDNTLLVNDRTNKPYRKAVEKGMLYIAVDEKNAPSTLEEIDGSVKYFALTSAGTHRLLVRVFPISDYAYESVLIEHDFQEKHVYNIRAFRKKPISTSNSLLELAPPKPICVVLLEGKNPIRQFCKSSNITSGVGGFTEELVTFSPEQEVTLGNAKTLSDVLLEIDNNIQKLTKQWQKK